MSTPQDTDLAAARAALEDLQASLRRLARSLTTEETWALSGAIYRLRRALGLTGAFPAVAGRVVQLRRTTADEFAAAHEIEPGGAA